MISLTRTIRLAFLLIALFLLIIVVFGVRQYWLSERYQEIMTVSEQAMFRFVTTREAVTESLLEESRDKLLATVPDLEKVNGEVARLQQNSLVPREFKLALVDKVDISGLIITVRRLAKSEFSPLARQQLQDQLRVIGDLLLQYDRIIVGEARSTLINFQLVMIGGMGLIISLASFGLIGIHRTTILPLLALTDYLREQGTTEGMNCSTRWANEVIQLTKLLQVSKVGNVAGPSQLEDESFEQQRALLAEMVNEAVNRLNGIINYSQLLADDTEASLDQEQRQLLEKVIEDCYILAEEWQSLPLVRGPVDSFRQEPGKNQGQTMTGH